MSLRMFQSGDRPATVMGRHTLGYTDEETDLIAKYFGTRVVVIGGGPGGCARLPAVQARPAAGAAGC
jgi:hypothetical protein